MRAEQLDNLDCLDVGNKLRPMTLGEGHALHNAMRNEKFRLFFVASSWQDFQTGPCVNCIA